MNTPTLRSALFWLAPAAVVCASHVAGAWPPQDRPATAAQNTEKEKVVQIQYLEFVTPDVDETCDALEKLHGVTFSEPVAEFGNARTAPLEGGGRIGVRAPMHEAETPVVRPYLLVEDIEAAVEGAAAAGGEIAMGPTEILNEPGRFAIYFQGGNQFGLWQR